VKSCRLVLSAVVAFSTSAFLACGSNGSSGSKSSGGTVSLSATGSLNGAIALNQGQSLSIVASVSGNGGVKWSLTGVGSLTDQTSTSATYVTPASVLVAATATVTATSTSDPTKSSSLQITVDPPITVTLSPDEPQSICVDQTIAITATVANDPKSAGVQWSVTGVNGSKNGSLTNETATSAVYNTANGFSTNDKYPTSFSATVIGTSVTDPTKSAQLAVTIAPLMSYDSPLPVGTFTQPYSFALPTTGPCGKPPYTWTTAGLPPGLTLNGNVISGIPTYPGSPFDEFFLTVTDSQTPVPNTATSNQQTIVINLPTVLTVLSNSLPQGEIGIAYSQSLLATAGTQPYTWSLGGGSLPPGIGIGATGVVSGTPTTAGTYNFTAKVTDSATPVTHTATANLSIVTQPKLAFTTSSLPSGSVGTAYAQQLQASGGVPPYTFFLTGGTLPPNVSMNSVDSSGIIAGVPSATGSSNFAITAQDTVSANASGNLSIQITGANCPNNANLSGNYAFLFSGPGLSDGTPFYDYVGSFTADGAGIISQGYVDSADTLSSGTPGTLTGSYCIGADNIGTVTLTGLGGFLVPATNDFQIVLHADGNGDATIYENAIDTSGVIPLSISGPVLKQDVSAFNTTKINGNYAFELLDSASTFAAQAGAFSADGQGNINGALDMNFLVFPNTTVLNDTTFSASDLVVSNVGRGTASFSVTGLGTEQVVFYVVNASQLLALETGKSINSILMAGQIVQQAPGTFADSSLSGVSVSGVQEFDNSQLPLIQAGLITWDGAGDFSWNADQNDAGTMSSPSFTGTYTVVSNGRVALTINGQPNSLVLYLTGPNKGFLYAPNNVITGEIMNQSGTAFTTASVSGNYAGGNWQALGSASLEVELLTADGAGNVTGTVDADAPLSHPYGPTSAQIAGTYTVSSNGRGTITQSGATTGIFYVVSPTQILMIPNATSTPTVVKLSH
jgi:hypothetical protein